MVSLLLQRQLRPGLFDGLRQPSTQSGEVLQPGGRLVRLSGVEVDAEFTAFCRAEWPRLVGSLALYTGDRDLGEELAQETLSRVFEHWAEVRDADSPRAWAHRVGLNLAKSHYRLRVALGRIRRLDP